MKKTFLVLPALFVLAVSAKGQAQEAAFIDWPNLKNPVLSFENRMLKDQAVVYKDGWFYIFCSNRLEAGDPENTTRPVCIYKTRDFKGYECFHDPDLCVKFGPTVKQAPGSTDLIEINGRWHMVFQSGPGKKFRRLYFSTSDDLEDWSPALPLLPEVQPRMRHIDGAFAYEGGHFYVGYKGKQKFYVTRSMGNELDGRWQEPLRASAGHAWAENFQFIKIDGTWRMIATARDPGKPIDASYTGSHEPFIYTMGGDGTRLEHWANWTNKTHLQVPYEEWNRVMHANSAYLCDWREHDGYFYLFYAGANDSKSFEKRGHGKIGVVRSRDLANWKLPGD